MLRNLWIKSEVPAIQGCIAEFYNDKSFNLIAKQKLVPYLMQDRFFCFPCSDKPRACPVFDTGKDLFRDSLTLLKSNNLPHSEVTIGRMENTLRTLR